jgi:hypothetical protein
LIQKHFSELDNGSSPQRRIRFFRGHKTAALPLITKYQLLNTVSRGAILATNPATSISTADQMKQMLKTVTDAALFIEQILGAATPNGGTGEFDAAATERVTAAFGSLAVIAIQAAHDVAGREVTPESVMALMPASTPLQPAIER